MKKIIRNIMCLTLTLVCIIIPANVSAQRVNVSKPKISAISQLDISTLKIEWKRAKKVNGYVLFYKQAGGKYMVLKTFGKNRTSFKHSGLTTGNKYFYKLKAFRKVKGKRYYSKSSKVVGKRMMDHKYVDNLCIRCGKVDPESLPVGLEKLHVIEGNSSFYLYDENLFQDSYGYTYNGVHVFGSSYSGVETIVYNLDQKYKTFTGSIVASPELASCAYADYYIYVDDKLVYSYARQEKTTAKIDFEIDVSNSTKLSIRAGAYKKPDAFATGYMGCACIVNAQLIK